MEAYVWKGEVVWFVPGPCCDFHDLVVDAVCEPLCAPSGGISGEGDGTCPNFFLEADRFPD